MLPAQHLGEENPTAVAGRATHGRQSDLVQRQRIRWTLSDVDAAVARRLANVEQASPAPFDGELVPVWGAKA